MKRLIASVPNLHINFEALENFVIATAKDWFYTGFIPQFKLEDLYNNTSLPSISDAYVTETDTETNAKTLEEWWNNDNFLTEACHGTFTEVIQEMDDLNDIIVILYLKDGKPHAEKFDTYFEEYCDNIKATFPQIEQDLQNFNIAMQSKNEENLPKNLEAYAEEFLSKYGNNYSAIIQDSSTSEQIEKIFSLE